MLYIRHRGWAPALSSLDAKVTAVTNLQILGIQKVRCPLLSTPSRPMTFAGEFL